MVLKPSILWNFIMKKLKDGKLLEEQGYQQSDGGLQGPKSQIGSFLHVFKKEVKMDVSNKI